MRILFKGVSCFSALLLAGLISLMPQSAEALLYGADSARNSATQNLYQIIDASGATTVIGPITDAGGKTYRVTGLAFDSANNILYGVSAKDVATNNRNGPRVLLTIDRTTAVATVVGTLLLPGAVQALIPDITFRAGVLYGRGKNARSLLSINTTTAAVSSIGAANNFRRALATDAAGVIYTATSNNISLNTVDAATGVETVGPTITGAPNGTINAMAFYNGTLYANGAQGSLLSIDVLSGVSTTLGTLPPQLDALAGVFVDSDADGMDDEWETFFGLNVGVDDGGLDPDADGLSNLNEHLNGGNPNKADTDNDGLNDGDEVNIHLTTVHIADTDGDGMGDGAEVALSRDPLVVEPPLPGAPSGPLTSADHPAVAEDAAGNVYVVWSDFNGTSRQLYFQMANAAGVLLIDTTELNVATSGYMPNVSVNAAGQVLITYYSDINNLAEFIQLSPGLDNQDGTPADPAVIVTVAPVTIAGIKHPKSALDAAGNLHVVGDTPAVYYKLDGNGAILIGPLALGASFRHYAIDVATDAAGNAHIIHTTTKLGSIFYTRVNAAGVIDIPALSFGGLSEMPSIAVDAAGFVYALDGGGSSGSFRVTKIDPAQFNAASLAAVNTANMTVYNVAPVTAGGSFASAFFASDGNLHVISNDGFGSGSASFYDTAINPATGALITDTLLSAATGGGRIGNMTMTQASPNWQVWPESFSSSVIKGRNVITGVAMDFQIAAVGGGNGNEPVSKRRLLLADMPAAALVNAPTLNIPLTEVVVSGVTPGGTVTLTLSYAVNIPVGSVYNKWTLATDWFTLPIGSDDGDNIITITLTDGGLGDADGVANGIIVDPGAPGGAVAAAAVIPAKLNTGGCVINAKATFDPMLPILAFLSLLTLWWRKKAV